MTFRILHVFDHSIPLQSGYTFRSRAILREQRRLGWETVHLTGPKQGARVPSEESVDGLDFHRTRCPAGPAKHCLLSCTAGSRRLWRFRWSPSASSW